MSRSGPLRLHLWTVLSVAPLTLAGCQPASGSPGVVVADTVPDRPEEPEPGATSECEDPDPAWIWCDDFEVDRTDGYFEFDDREGAFRLKDGAGRQGTAGMTARFEEGRQAAGSLKLALGTTPDAYFEPVDEGVERYRDLYWRFYLRNEPSWSGGGGHKLTRATVFTGAEWSQAMIAHVWSGSHPHEHVLVIDPASGVDPGSDRVKTSRYNDFDNLRWLGVAHGRTRIFDAAEVGRWHCIEVRARLNDPGRSDGAFELWIDDTLEARATDLDWTGSYTEYGINAIFLENYWDDGAPRSQERHFDNLVVSTERIGCLQ